MPGANRVCFLTLLSGFMTLHSAVTSEGDYQPTARLRRPTALALSADEKSLFVANRDAGSITEIDVSSLGIRAEHPVGGRLVGLATAGPNDLLLTIDQGGSRLLVMGRSLDGLETLAEISLPADPAQLAISDKYQVAAISCRWAHQVAVVDIAPLLKGSPGPPLGLPCTTIALPFAPARLLVAEKHQVIVVADAFGSNLAAIDLKTKSLRAVHEVAGHNMAGLAIDENTDQLLITHQHLNRLARTRRDDVFWGTVLSNVLEAYPMAQVLEATPKRLTPAAVTFLGDPDHGAGDPAAICLDADGGRFVAVAGIAEIAIQKGKDPLRFVPVGMRPIDLATAATRNLVFVANMFSDSISVLDSEKETVLATIALGPEVALSAAEQGEQHFYDARLSLGGWYSCHSCHTDGHTSGGSSDTAGDGGFGAPKQILSLLGVADTPPWGWLGDVNLLEDQVHQSITSTMQGLDPGSEVIRSLRAYLETLTPPVGTQAKLELSRRQAGEVLFSELGCAVCHRPPSYTTPATYDVALPDEVNHSRFNPPSLRGVSQRTNLFHDGRARSLQAVFSEHRHQLHRELSDEELTMLVTFLESL